MAEQAAANITGQETDTPFDFVKTLPQEQDSAANSRLTAADPVTTTDDDAIQTTHADDPTPSTSPAVPTASPTPAPKRHPLSLRVAARGLGASDADIDAAEPDQLADFVLNGLNRQQQPAQTAAAAPKEPDDPLDAFDFGTDAEGKKLTKDYYDAPSQQFFRTIAKKQIDVEKRIAAREQAEQQRQAYEQQRQQAAVMTAIDEAFVNLAKTHPDHFTDTRFVNAPADVITKNATELDRRRALISAAGGDPARLAKVAETLLGKGKTATDSALETRRAEWSKGKVSKPTNRGGAKELAAKGVAAAEAAVGEKLKEMGIRDEDDQSLDISQFPD